MDIAIEKRNENGSLGIEGMGEAGTGYSDIEKNSGINFREGMRT